MDLHLNVKAEYFDAHCAGEKDYEYRLNNEYWRKRLIGKSYKNIHYKSGYPKRGDQSKIKIIKYTGCKIETRTHPHFGPDPVEVFAISLKG